MFLDTGSCAQNSIENIIDNFHPKKLSAESSVLSNWEILKHDQPVLYNLAGIVHAVPATQVSVERCFSALKLILSDHRFNLSEDTINNILTIRLNYDFDA